MYNYQQLMQMLQQQMPSHITTEHIQQYLDENKALILRIIENQNKGKLDECAENQARLQRNLMYLAAIADTQPPPMHGMQFARSAGVTQAGASYVQQQQNQQSAMAGRSSMLYAPAQEQQYPAAMHQYPAAMHQQQYPAMVQQQQMLNEQLGMSLAGSSKHHTLQNEASVGGTNGGGAYLPFSYLPVEEGTIRQQVGGTGNQASGSDGQTGTSGGRYDFADEGHDFY